MKPQQYKRLNYLLAQLDDDDLDPAFERLAWPATERRRAPTLNPYIMLGFIPVAVALVYIPPLKQLYLNSLPVLVASGMLLALIALWRGVRLADKYAMNMAFCFAFSSSLVLPVIDPASSGSLVVMVLLFISLTVFTVLTAGVTVVSLRLQAAAST